MKSLLKGSTALAGALVAFTGVAVMAPVDADAQNVPSIQNDKYQSKRTKNRINRAAYARIPELGASGTEGAVAELQSGGQYLAGDKHNHTVCSDGSTSPKVLADQSLVAFGLDWFGMVGHGGSGTRDCRFTDADYTSLLGGAVKNRVFGVNAKNGDQRFYGFNEGALWDDTIGRDAILGDESLSTSRVTDDPDTPERERAKAMWRWQSIRDFLYQDVAMAGIQAKKPAFTGLEWVVPGHEHGSAAILDGQFPGGRIGQIGNADAMAQFEYLWDRADNDFSGGKEAGYEDILNNGIPKIANVAGDHSKSVQAVQWLRVNFPLTSFAVSAHVERQGGYVPTANRGFNVEHLRDWHNAGLLADDIEAYSVSFGSELQPGHQAQFNRGSYTAGRPTAGLGTYGGVGAYGAAEVALPGKNFDGEDLTPEDLEGTGVNPAILDSTPERVVLGRPGVSTMWDALLAEGRRFFHVGSSDWHNRGSYGPFEPATTNDFWPGEYQKMYSYVENDRIENDRRQAQAVVEGLRSGNTYTVMGDLIGDDFTFVACYDVTGECVTMGQELKVQRGKGNVEYMISLTDPEGVNYSPYEFNNPSLLQVGIEQPVNQPVLHHVDVITGDITGEIKPGTPEYTSVNSNPSTKLFFTFDETNWEAGEGGKRVMRWTVPVRDINGDSYVRVRGTNIPQGTPYEQNADGNPVLDSEALNIVCPFESNPELAFDPNGCPAHLPTNDAGQQVLAYDLAAWADLWFYANPIFIEVEGGRRGKGKKKKKRG